MSFVSVSKSESDEVEQGDNDSILLVFILCIWVLQWLWLFVELCLGEQVDEDTEPIDEAGDSEPIRSRQSFAESRDELLMTFPLRNFAALGCSLLIGDGVWPVSASMVNGIGLDFLVAAAAAGSSSISSSSSSLSVRSSSVSSS